MSVSVRRMPSIKETALAESVQWRPAHPWRWPRRLASAPASTDTVAAFRPWRSFRSSVARGRRGHHRRCVSDALKRAGKQTSRKLVWMLVGSAQSHVVKCAGSLTELLSANTSTGARRSQGLAGCGHLHTLDRRCPSPDAGWAVWSLTGAPVAPPGRLKKVPDERGMPSSGRTSRVGEGVQRNPSR